MFKFDITEDMNQNDWELAAILEFNQNHKSLDISSQIQIIIRPIIDNDEYLEVSLMLGDQDMGQIFFLEKGSYNLKFSMVDEDINWPFHFLINTDEK